MERESTWEVNDENSQSNVAGAKANVSSSPNQNKEVKFTNSKLVEETLILYRQSKCVLCKERARGIVTLPCSHFTLCKQCIPLCSHCPLSDCKLPIELTIVTYLV